MSKSEMTAGTVLRDKARLQDRVRAIAGLIQQLWLRHDDPNQAMLSWIRALAHIPRFMEDVFGLRVGCGRKLIVIMEQEVRALLSNGNQVLYIPAKMYSLQGSCVFNMAHRRYVGESRSLWHYGEYLPMRPGVVLEKIVPRGPDNEFLPNDMNAERWHLLRQLEMILRRGDRPPRGRPRLWAEKVPVASPNVLHVYLGGGRASCLQYQSKRVPVGRLIGQMILRLGRDLASSGRVVTLPFKVVLRAMQGKDASRLTQDEVRKKIGTLKSYASRINDALNRVGLATGVAWPFNGAFPRPSNRLAGLRASRSWPFPVLLTRAQLRGKPLRPLASVHSPRPQKITSSCISSGTKVA
jgi:hypothetical protein